MVTYHILYIPCILTLIIGMNFVDAERIHLEKLSTIYLPYRYENNVGLYRYPSGAVEQLAYDSSDKTLYTVGGSVLHILDIKDPGMSVMYWEQFDTVTLTDVELCGDHLFLAVNNNEDKENGYVNAYRKYNTTSGTLELVNTITVGSLPDMVLPTSDCLSVVVAIEAKPYSNGSHFVDPEGAVGIIKFDTDTGVEGTYRYTKLDFRKFNDRWQDLVSRGARYIYRENSFSNDVEPEYITFNKDESIAYISLQDNNAVAVVDIATQNITNIFPLGFKNWSNFDFDASNKDKKINIRPWPVMGMYQPDAIKVVYIKGKPYLLTANEGDSKDYSDIQGSEGFNEESRVSVLDINASSKILQWANSHGFNGSLSFDENLGRLKVTNLDGKSGDTYNTLYSFGARSISLFDLSTFELVYDSGGEIEKMIAQQEDALFNANGKDGNDLVSATKDSRSDDKGPEVETLAVAYFGDMVVLFVGLERPGFIAVYSIPDDVISIRFESLYTGIKRTNDTYSNLYDQRELSEIDPEDIRFINAQESPTHQPLLLCTGTHSGTVSLLRVKGLEEVNGVGNIGIRTSGQLDACSIGLIVLGTMMHFFAEAW